MRKLSFEINFGKPEKVEGKDLDALNENMCVLARVIEWQTFMLCKEEGYYEEYVKVMNLIQDYMGEGNIEAAKRIYGAMAMACDEDLMAMLDTYVYSDELSANLFFGYFADCIADRRIFTWIMETSGDESFKDDEDCDDELCDDELYPVVFDELQEARERRDENEEG